MKRLLRKGDDKLDAAVGRQFIEACQQRDATLISALISWHSGSLVMLQIEWPDDISENP